MSTENIIISRVSSKKEMKEFVRFNYELYKDNPYAVPDLLEDTLDTFNKKKNPAFRFCEAEWFLARRNGKIVGRICAIINHKANEQWNQKTVRFGWIDFIDDREVSKALLDAVEKYGREKGMEDVVGPLGFTDMDPEGMLVWGFDQLGTMPTIYNYAYYPEHIEALEGFEVDNKYVEFKIMVPDEVPEKYAKIAMMIEKRYNLHVRKLTKKDIFQGGMGQKIFDLINDTYKDLYGYSELSQKQIDQLIKSYLGFLDFNLITCIEDWTDGEHKLIGVGITMPSLAHALRKCRRGRLLPFGWFHVLRAIKMHKTNIVDLLLIGILPEYRAKGANALLFADLIPWYQKYGIEWGETQVELETNAGVQGQWGALTPVMHKRRKCYKKIIK